MIAYPNMPTNAYHDKFQSSFSRIYNLLDHPSKDHYTSKYSRYNNVFVISTNHGTVDQGNYLNGEDHSSG